MPLVTLLRKLQRVNIVADDRGVVADDSGERCEAHTCVVNVFRSLLFEAISYYMHYINYSEFNV